MQMIRKDLPPTPAKFHYFYNLADLSKIFAGMLLTNPAVCKHSKRLTRLWRHEFTRVMRDRLLSDKVSATYLPYGCHFNCSSISSIIPTTKGKRNSQHANKRWNTTVISTARKTRRRRQSTGAASTIIGRWDARIIIIDLLILVQSWRKAQLYF